MNAVQFLASAGTAIGFVGAASLLLQARRLMRLGSACEISIPIRLVSVTGYAVWLAYGIAIGDVPLILVDVAGLAAAGFVLHVTLVLRRRQACPVAVGYRTASARRRTAAGPPAVRTNVAVSAPAAS